jgi:hypothetical protein
MNNFPEIIDMRKVNAVVDDAQSKLRALKSTIDELEAIGIKVEVKITVEDKWVNLLKDCIN